MDISKVMKLINMQYAVFFNKKHLDPVKSRVPGPRKYFFGPFGLLGIETPAK
jgi:hypothetical protein